MYLYSKDVEKIGFKGSGIFDSKCHHFYYAKLSKSKKVYIINNYEQSISHFDLTEKEWKNFNNGKLSLIPIGCCNASGGKSKEHPILDFEGDFKKVFKTRNKTLEFIQNLMQ